MGAQFRDRHPAQCQRLPSGRKTEGLRGPRRPSGGMLDPQTAGGQQQHAVCTAAARSE
jgi:hypothetical protein